MLLLRLLVLLLFATLSPAGLAQSARWQRAPLDSVASVEFPDSVGRQQVKGHEVLVCKVGPTICIALKQPTNSVVGLFGNNSREFTDGMVQGLLQETGGKLLHRSYFRVGEFTGVEVEFATPAKPQLPATKFTRLLMVHGTVYTLNYWTDAAPTAATAAERTRFFSSLRLNAEAANKQSGSYKLGKVIGALGLLSVAATVIIGLPVALVLILRRRRQAR